MSKKRFIAGAVCPACQRSDTLQWWHEMQIEHIRCVECGHQDQRLPEAVEQSEAGEQIVTDQVIGIFKPE